MTEPPRRSFWTRFWQDWFPLPWQRVVLVLAAYQVLWWLAYAIDKFGAPSPLCRWIMGRQQ